MKIKPLLKSDLAEAITVIKASFETYVKPSWSQNAIEAFYTKDIAIDKLKSLLDSDNICLKCTVDDCISGVLLFSSKRKLAYLFVSPEENGKGIAKKLFDAAKLQVDDSVDYIELASTEYAVPVYEKLGFRKSANAFLYNDCTFQPMVYWMGNYRLNSSVQIIES
ncbi:GNAT family N-acetyltransferase [Reinekea marina]|uniref:GNAT family N-acetyltransferase n=1 Tax=Reinekea marina TaxID=1310421 RepID=A0ABV7WPR5_9GAMM|nr:GNAT family N-acetyltransferase [Reinekea marina]MDN3648536.1 GNAT family N-acetyltransferase [Reinekea marina]